MGLTFILAEKQEAAKRIAYALDDNHSAKLLTKGDVPYFEATNNGNTLRIISAVGHLYTIAPKKRGYAYPVFDVHWVAAHNFNRRLAYTKKWIDAIAEVSRDAAECISATDYDVEGELIGYTTLRFACKEKEREAKRMVFSTLTDVELQRAFSDLVSELDMYGFIQARVFSHGRYGRTKEITSNLPKEISDRLRQVILMEFDLNPIH